MVQLSNSTVGFVSSAEHPERCTFSWYEGNLPYKYFFFEEFSFSVFISTGHFKNRNILVIYYYYYWSFLIWVFDFFIALEKQKRRENQAWAFFYPYLQSKLSFRLLRLGIFGDSASILFLMFNILSVCLCKLLGATAMGDKAPNLYMRPSRDTGHKEICWY